jgi:hypothetical protein
MAYRRFQPWMLNGRPGNVNRRIKGTIRRAVNAGLYVTSTTGGQHASGSWHYSGKAVDVAGSYDKMVRFQRSEYNRGRFHFGRWKYLELFGPVNYLCLKNGSPITLGEGTGLENLHDTHVHVARP